MSQIPPQVGRIEFEPNSPSPLAERGLGGDMPCILILEAQLAALKAEAAALRDLALTLAELAQSYLRIDSDAYRRITELCDDLRKDTDDV